LPGATSPSSAGRSCSTVVADAFIASGPPGV
jgi:hypothetical protein